MKKKAWFNGHTSLRPQEAISEDAPVFPYVWEKIEPIIEGLPLVAHNSRCDDGCLKSVAAACGYDLANHHHALADAEACAAIALRII